MTAFQRLSALLALSLATFAATAQPAATPATGATTRVLFVGNSMTYANNLPRILRALAASQPGGPAIDTATYVIPGAELDELWDDGHAAAALREGDWDVVVLQERGGLVLCNARTTRTPECRRSDAAHRAFADLAKARGARSLLLMTWPPARGTDLKDAHGLDKLGERLQNSYATLERRLARGGAPVSVVPAATTLYAQPARTFTVTGTITDFTTAATIDSARSGSFRRAAPAPVLHTLGTQHPMLMSTMSAPISSARMAVSAITLGSGPKI